MNRPTELAHLDAGALNDVRQSVTCGYFGLALLVVAIALSSGCASRQYGHLLASNDKDMVGSHAAGAATWNPLVDESVAKILSRCPPPVQTVAFEGVNNVPMDNGVIGSALATGPASVCFIGVENKSAEELGDFKDQLYEQIDSQINSAETFRGISRRMVDAALIETRMRPEALMLPQNRAVFAASLGRQGSPVDYLMFATVTTGTTDRNKSTQRDYTLTLEMVNLHTGEFLKESAKIRKGYSKTRAGKWWNFGIFDQADG
ncbi:penicillin-binding protein activator LpoB [Rubripirellula amarantea]|nr:penicillin-binding protein activator LpoB [Rubripirellula amarantea]